MRTLAILGICLALTVPQKTIIRDRQGRTVGSYTTQTHRNGSITVKYRDTKGRSVGSSTTKVQGSKIVTYHKDNKGRTVAKTYQKAPKRAQK